MSIKEFVANLTKEDMKLLEEEFRKKEQIKPTYAFSRITDNILNKYLNVTLKFNKNKFDTWFLNDINIIQNDIEFLNNLIREFGDFIKNLNEETLKAYFIIPILNRVNFFLIKDNYNGLYEESLRYETNKFIFNGTTDFVIAKGTIKAEKPYFFIQEFKKGQKDGYPKSQLLAELIAGVELNNWKSIKGAYIVGANWYFVILEKLGKDNYQYFVSRQFDSSRLDDLKDIYKNLIFIKNEIISMIENGDK